MASQNPWEIPGWRAIGREAALVNQLVGSGATALGRANYGDRIGEYYTAFFGLSIGIERLAKLVLVADHALANQGELPDQALVRRFGHKLADLCEAVDNVVQRRQMNLEYQRPTNDVASKIVECLDIFAGQGRYANFQELGDPNLGDDEPIRAWWDSVAEAILNAHYYGRAAERRVERNAEEVHWLMAPISSVLFVSETNDVMNSPRQASLRTGQAEIVQRYGRYYALTVVRWLTCVFAELSHDGGYGGGAPALFGAWEHLQSYRVPDDLLKTRKNWPLT